MQGDEGKLEAFAPWSSRDRLHLITAQQNVHSDPHFHSQYL